MTTIAHFNPPPILLLDPQFIIEAVTDVSRMVKADFDAVTEGWLAENMPEWSERMYVEAGDLIWEYITTSTPFVFVDQGTPPHLIEASGSGYLTFRRGWAPKTYPGARRAMPGGRWGDFVKKKTVSHPGVEPRRFSEDIATDAAKVLVAILEGHLRLFIKGGP